MDRIGRYEILSELGKGSFAVVLRARMTAEHGFSKIVALKLLYNDLASEGADEAKALINEARVGSKLKHPNIVDTYDFGLHEGHPYIVMEHIDGLTLAQILECLKLINRRVPAGLVLHIALKLASALDYAHTAKDPETGAHLALVHRDLKPQNIMLSDTGELKLLDFGIARSTANLFQTNRRPNHTETRKGTPAYMSPEQIHGEAPVDPRSDLFSLGVILGEIATLEHPFPANGLPMLFHRILSLELDPWLSRVSEVCTELAPIIKRLMQRDPQARFSSAGEAMRAIETAANNYRIPSSLRRLVAVANEIGRGTALIDIPTLSSTSIGKAKQARSSAPTPGDAAFDDPIDEDPLTDELLGLFASDGEARSLATAPDEAGLRLPEFVITEDRLALLSSLILDGEEIDPEDEEGSSEDTALIEIPQVTKHAFLPADIERDKAQSDPPAPVASPLGVEPVPTPRTGLPWWLSGAAVLLLVGLVLGLPSILDRQLPGAPQDLAQEPAEHQAGLQPPKERDKSLAPEAPVSVDPAQDSVNEAEPHPTIDQSADTETTTRRSNEERLIAAPPIQEVRSSDPPPIQNGSPDNQVDAPPQPIESTGTRLVFVNAKPWCLVEAGGKQLGRTPLKGAVLPPEVTTLTLRTQDGSARTKNFQLGDNTEKLMLGCWDFGLGAPCVR